MKKKILAILLTAAMVLETGAAGVLADETAGTDASSQVEESSDSDELLVDTTGSTFEVDGVTYTVTSEDTCEVSLISEFSEELVIPETVTTDYGEVYTVTGTADNAFSGAAGVKSLTIPKTLTYFGGGSRFSNLETITIEDGNEALFLHDGVLFEKTEDGIALDLYPSASEDVNYVVPLGVTEIKSRAFYGVKNMQILAISESVQKIDEEAIADFANSVEIAFNTDTAPAEIAKNAISLTETENNILYFKSADVYDAIEEKEFAGESNVEIVTDGISDGISTVIDSLQDDISEESIEAVNGDTEITDLTEGWYVIKSGLSNGSTSYALDIAEGVGGTAADANTDIYTYDATDVQDSQLFYVKIIDAENGIYTFVPYGNQKFALDCVSAQTAAGTNVRQHKSNNTVAQQFKVVETSTDGEYEIIVSNGTTCLTVNGNKASDGANVELGNWSNKAGQRWSFVKTEPDTRNANVAEGYYYITSNLKGTNGQEYNLDIGKNSGVWANYTNVDVYAKREKSEAQIFYLKIADATNGTYTISPVTSSDYVLDATNGAYTNGTNIQEYKSNGSAAQQYKILINSDGSYEIKSSVANTCLTVESSTGKAAAKGSNGANVALGTWKNSDAQKWTLTDASADVRKTVQLDEGWYTIKSKLTDGSGKSYSLDINKNSSSATKGLNLDIYRSSSSSDAQYFYLSKVSGTDDVYRITPWNYRIGALDADTAKYTEGTNFRQWKSNNTTAQQFQIFDNGDGTYSIRCYIADAYVTVEASNSVATTASNGSNVALYRWRDADAQKWTFEKTTDRNLEDTDLGLMACEIHTAIGAKSSSDTSTKALTIDGSSLSNYSNAVIKSSNNSDSQKFVLYPLGNSKYYILTADSYKALDVNGGSTNPCTNITIYDKNGSKAQIWTIKKDKDGYYHIYSELSSGNAQSVVMDVASGQSNEGQNVQLYTENQSTAQKWIIKESSMTSVSNANYYISSGLKSDRSVVFDIPKRASTENLQYQIFYYKGILSQMFKVTNVNGGVTLQNIHTGKYVAASGTKVVQKSSAYTWKLVSADKSGNFYLKASNGYYISIQDQKTDNMTAVILTASPDSSSTWSFTKCVVPDGWYQQNGNWYYYSNGSMLKNKYVGNAYLGSDGKLWTGWHKAAATSGVVTCGYWYYFDGKNGAAMDARPWMMSSSNWKKTTKTVTINNHGNTTTTTQTGIDTNYILHVNTKKCYIIVYAEYPSGGYAPVFSFKTSPGTAGNDTNVGNSYIKAQYNWTELMGPSYGQYTSLVNYTDGEYIHSVACGYCNDHNVDAGAYNLLGQRASHGCMRVNVRNAFWVYCYCKVGTGVIIRDNDELPLTISLRPQPKMTGQTAVDPCDPAYTGNYGYTDTNTYYGSYYFS